MPVILEGRNLSARWRKRSKEVSRQIEAALKEDMREAVTAARGLTSARAYSMKDAKQRRFAPYSRRRPRPPLPPFLVNIQTGLLERSWHSQVHKTPNGYTGTLYNTAPEARFMTEKGTRRMMPRPLLKELLKILQGNRRRRAKEAVRKALRTK